MLLWIDLTAAHAAALALLGCQLKQIQLLRGTAAARELREISWYRCREYELRFL